jgi:hypothetical protein
MSKISLEGNVSGSGTLTIAAPNTNSNFTLTLPDNTGTIVTTGTTTGISASAISTGTLAAARLPAGTVLQVVTTNFPTVVSQAGTAGTWFDISGFSASITPASASNKILVVTTIGRAVASSGTVSVAFRVLRGATAVGVGSGMTGSQVAASFVMTNWTNDNQQGGGTAHSFIDSPATTSSTTYQVSWMPQGSMTYYLNRTGNNVNSNDSFGAYTLSTLTLMEIAG